MLHSNRIMRLSSAGETTHSEGQITDALHDEEWMNDQINIIADTIIVASRCFFFFEIEKI